MFGRRKSKKSDPVDPVKLETPGDNKPSVAAADTGTSFARERGGEADDIRPRYDAHPVHPSEGQRFSFDIDGPVPHPLQSRRS
ncbi:hypothetical protein [Archangium lipolyticum]|uniref:hypothetical protein n=1 Tax=Archangium lipolyticum TaxID=2970465 RepID=UPI002149C8C3|nr:hypothetical protein [Archangium lipolyticum]